MRVAENIILGALVRGGSIKTFYRTDTCWSFPASQRDMLRRHHLATEAGNRSVTG